MVASKKSKQSYITLITSETPIYTLLIHQSLLSIILAKAYIMGKYSWKSTACEIDIENCLNFGTKCWKWWIFSKIVKFKNVE